MRRNFLVIALVSALCLAGASVASAQGGEGFVLGYTDVGPTLGLGGVGGADFAIGGRFEKGIKALPNLADGILGIQGSVDWYDYDNNIFGVDYGWTFIAIAAMANYHFQLENKKIDPFVGAGLGYLHASFDCGGFDCDAGDGIYFTGRAGIRYFLRPKMALYADVGAGAATLNIGLMFKIGGN
jgi:hypothetical protein